MKTKKIFIPVFTLSVSIITYSMQRKRSSRHNKNTDNPDGIRYRIMLQNPVQKLQKLPAQSWMIYISRKNQIFADQ